MVMNKKTHSNSIEGFAHLMLVVLAIAVVAVITAVGIYVHDKENNMTVTDRSAPATIAKGNIENTFSKNGKIFPNLPVEYNLVYQHTAASGFEDAEYLTAKTKNEIKDDMNNICKDHKFTLQNRGGNENNTVACIDQDNNWLFVIDSQNNLTKQPWYKDIETNVPSLTNWLHVESAGTPVYNQ